MSPSHSDMYARLVMNWFMIKDAASKPMLGMSNAEPLLLLLLPPRPPGRRLLRVLAASSCMSISRAAMLCRAWYVLRATDRSTKG